MGRHIGLDLKAYNDFKAFLRSSCGIELGDNKEYLGSNVVIIKKRKNNTHFVEL